VEIREKCSCGASFHSVGVDAEKLHKAWVRRHTCPDQPEIQRDIETSSTIGFTADYQGTGLDVPAKRYDPWDE
jgi:hypothetical protein